MEWKWGRMKRDGVGCHPRTYVLVADIMIIVIQLQNLPNCYCKF